MCYWRRLSRRSANDTLLADNRNELTYEDGRFDPVSANEEDYDERLETGSSTTTTTTRPNGSRRAARKLKADGAKTAQSNPSKEESTSESVSLFQALEVRQERGGGENSFARSTSSSAPRRASRVDDLDEDLYAAADEQTNQMCYRRAEIFAFLLTVGSILLAAISVTVGCCLRASSIKSAHKRCYRRQQQLASYASSANLCRQSFGSKLSSPTTTSSTSTSSPASSSLGLNSVESYYAQCKQSSPARNR